MFVSLPMIKYLLISCCALFVLVPVSAQQNKFFYDTEDPSKSVTIQSSDKTNIGAVIDKTVINPTAQSEQDSVLHQLLKVFGIESYIKAQNGDKPQPAIAYVNMIINIFLGLASFIAFIVIVWWFYQMFFSGDEADAYNKAQAKVRGAALAFLILATSWIIIRFAFQFFSDVRI